MAATLPRIPVAPGRFLEDIGVSNGRELRPGLAPTVHQVWSDGHHANEASLNLYEPLPKLQERLEVLAPSLAWVSFGRLSPTEPSGLAYPLPSTFVTERTDAGLVLQTGDQILEEGTLGPAMEEWLGALVSRGAFTHVELRPFIELL